MSGQRRNGPARSRGQDEASRETKLRVIGGELRGRGFTYDGNSATRPMKDRVREAVFNLVGPSVRGKAVMDLFAGTGAMAFESLSRGAARAVLIERRFPAAELIRENARQLGLASQVTVIPGDAFVWSRKCELQTGTPWLVFLCPPYDLFVKNCPEMLALMDQLAGRAPAESIFVVESDERFDPELLPRQLKWDVRHYPPAVVAIGEFPGTGADVADAE